MTGREKELRNNIFDNVRKIYKIREETKKPFVPGNRLFTTPDDILTTATLSRLWTHLLISG